MPVAEKLPAFLFARIISAFTILRDDAGLQSEHFRQKCVAVLCKVVRRNKDLEWFQRIVLTEIAQTYCLAASRVHEYSHAGK